MLRSWRCILYNFVSPLTSFPSIHPSIHPPLALPNLKRNAELEAVILEDPLDPAAWLVYGDWLEEVGDPRGELVAVQARLARDPGNPELMDAQQALLLRHGDALLEGLHDYLRGSAGTPGPPGT